MDGSARGWRRPAVAALIATVLLVVVALASGRRSWSGGSSGSRHLPARFWDVTITVGLILWLAVVGWAAWTMWRDRRGPGEKPARDPKKVLLMAFVTLLLFSVTAALYVQHRRAHGNPGAQTGTLESPGNPNASPHPKGDVSGRTPHLDAPSAIVTVVILALLGLVAIAVRRHLRGLEDDHRKDAAAAVARVLAVSIDDLRSEPDPRKAVIAAYARMELTLGGFGLGRHESEAPGEYLVRVLAQLGATGASARRLTDLFERAKFSTHAIDTGMKDEAIDALVVLRAELTPE